MVRRIGLLILAFGLLLNITHRAYAAEESPQTGATELANPFSDFVPFEDEYDVDEDERFMYFGRFFAVSLGSGLHKFGGNIGKLYNTAIPVLDFRLIYFFDFRLAGEIGLSSASHAFSAQEVGVTEVNILRVNADLKYYLDTKNWGAAVTMANPYVIAGVSQTFRTQAFQNTGKVEKDNALALSAGAGMEFALKPRKVSLGIEGRMHQIYFKDRNEQTFLPLSGLPDTTGNMYSMITSVIFFF
jgi:opacity protein-like surface antigen